MIAPRQEVLFGWGMANHARSLVYRPRTVEEVREALSDAYRRGLSVVHRGAGQSYGDAALNQGGATIMTTSLDRILNYDSERGVVRAEAGLTIDQLWRNVIADAWWPPVVPGTSRTTLGGCLAMNVHGKNHVQAGSFGAHVRSVTIMKPDGCIETIRSDEAAFGRHVGGQGLFGTILALELALARIESGYLEVVARTASDLTEAMALLHEFEKCHDYTVGWIDCASGGGGLGRGEVHAASYLPGGHELTGAGLSVTAQEPSGRIGGLLPRDRVRELFNWLLHPPNVRAVNALKYMLARFRHPSRYVQAHACFHFLLDYIPDWNRVFEPDGMIQYQFFVPQDEAESVFSRALQLQHEHQTVSHLGVLKRHCEDPFPNNYSVNGYSLALDFRIRERRMSDLCELLAAFDALQADAGGSIYAAKDAVSCLGTAPQGRSDRIESNLIRRWNKS